MRIAYLAVITASVLVLTACPADRQAAEPVDMRPDPRIEAAPAYPTPPGEVPIGLQPDSPGVAGQDTLRGTGAPGTAAPGAPPANRP
jgi:hypothetical protein